MDGNQIIDWAGETVDLDDLIQCPALHFDCFAFCYGKCSALSKADENCTFYKPLEPDRCDDGWIKKTRNKLYKAGGFVDEVEQRISDRLLGGVADWDL